MLELADLHVCYGAIHAIKGISIKIGRGRVVTLIGANGAGKSTVLRTIAGLVKPRSGRIRHQDADITGWAPERVIRRGIARFMDRPRMFEAIGASQTHQMALYDMCGRWVGEEGNGLASRMLAGLGGNENANAGFALWGLARR